MNRRDIDLLSATAPHILELLDRFAQVKSYAARKAILRYLRQLEPDGGGGSAPPNPDPHVALAAN